jgi:uncharacterized Zn finger protein
MGWFYQFKPYVPVAQRRAAAAREVAKRAKSGQKTTPVCISGRAIADTFWGKAWCTNLEGYSDFENRLPRGRTYVRNGSVVHLEIEKGKITALVSGSSLYKIQIDISALSKQKWAELKKQCAGKIGTLVELLQGKLSSAVMEVVTHREQGLFPKPAEIKMSCSCPDYADMCKHLAAVMYGVGNRLDSSPDLLFRLRGIDHQELIEQALPTAPTGKGTAPTLAAEGLGDIFGIEIDEAPAPELAPKRGLKVKAKPTPKLAVKKPVKKATAAKKAVGVTKKPARVKAPKKG